MNDGSTETEQTQTEPTLPDNDTSSDKSNGRLSSSEQTAAIEQLLSGDQPNETEPVQPGSIDSDEAGDGGGGPDEEGSPTDQSKAEGGRLTIDALAQKLDLDPSEIYKALTITTGDGETATLEQLKDSFAKRNSEAQGTALKATELDRREASLATDIQSLGVLDAMQAIPDNIRQSASQHLNQMAEREWNKFTHLAPELEDTATRLQFDKDVQGLLQPYGLSPEHFGVRTVGMLRLIRDVVKDRKHLKKLTEPRPAKAPEPVKRNRVIGKTAPTPRGNGRQAELASIAGLLKG